MGDLGAKKSIGNVNGIMKNDNGLSSLQIERPVYQIEELNRDQLYERPHRTLKEKCSKICRDIKPVSCLKQTVPMLEWLPEYSWKKSFIGDLISGITVAIMHIPQGMAYGILGGVPPVVGIYMGFFPVLIYFLFGTSRHVSIGTFAIVCLMTGKVVNQYTTVEVLQNGTMRSLATGELGDDLTGYTSIQIATTVTFTVALIQFAMYVLRLGMVSQLLSDTLVNAFTCASAFHIVASQLKDLLGIAVAKRRGNFSFFLTVYDAIMAVPGANNSAITISFIAVVLMSLNNEIFKPWLAKKTKIPFPIELVAVIVGTACSYFMNFSDNYNITTVGHIPTGFPEPALPKFELIPSIFMDTFVITMVSYTITMSMALIFAKKAMYEIDSNQELLALGLSNLTGSFFSCITVTASLGRSSIQYAAGGVTQIASVISCAILSVVLLWIGPIFESLPRCVLASIIVVALKGMLMQCTAIVRYWRLSRWDGITWIVTFAITLGLQISYGLAAGVAVSLLSVFIQGYTPYSCLLGQVPNTDLYLDIKRYKTAQEINGLKIFHYSGGLSFASRSSFKEVLNRKTGIDAAEMLRKKKKYEEKGVENGSTEELLTKCIVLDFSCVTFVDPAGVDFLRGQLLDYGKLGVSMFISGCSGPVYEVMIKCDQIEKKQNKFMIFHTVHDAVLYAQANVLSKKDT